MKNKKTSLELSDAQLRVANVLINLVMDHPAELARGISTLDLETGNKEEQVHLFALLDLMEKITKTVHEKGLCLDKNCPGLEQEVISNAKTYAGIQKGARRKSQAFSWDQLKQ